MRWWGSKPQSVTAKSIDSAAYLRLHFYSSLSYQRFILPFSGSSIPFLPTPVPIPYFHPYFTRRRRFCIYFHPLLPPPLLPGCGATVHLDGTPARRPSPLVRASLPFRAAQRSFSHKPCLTSPVRLDLPSRGPFLLLPTSINLTPTPPPQYPAGTGWWRCVLLPPPPVIPSQPPHVMRLFLVFSEF